MTSSHPATAIPERLSPTNRLVIMILIIAAFVVILNETVMSVALPSLMADLDIDAGTAQWLTAGFMLTMAVLIPITGFILQRLTTRTVFLLAMSLFSAGTLLAALAPGFSVLLVARVVQASGTAVMIPLLMTTVLNLVPPARRGAFMGTVSIVIAVAPAIGPTLSGLILQYLSWRFMFVLVLPIALTALIIGGTKLTNVGTRGHQPIDIVSVLLTVPAFGAFVFGLNQLGQGGGARTVALAALAIGIVSLVVFAVRQIRLQRSGNPLLDLRVLGYSAYRKSLAITLLAMIAMFGMIVILPLYLQEARGLNTLQTGLLMLPGGLFMGVMSPITGRLFDRYGPKGLMLIGTGVLVSMLTAFCFVDQHTPVWQLGAQYALMMGGGMGLLMTPAMTNGLNPLPPHLYSHGSATLMTLQQVAGAAGTAMLIAVMAVRTVGLSSTGVSDIAARIGGFHASFAVGAVAAAVAFVLAIFVTRALPAEPVAASGADEDGVEARVPAH